jgi:hypothetical protein
MKVVRTMDRRRHTTAQQENHPRKVDPEKQSHDRAKNSIEGVKAAECDQVPGKDILAQFKKQSGQQGSDPDLAEARGSARSEFIEH